jgi:hypothetical protein
LNLAFDFLPVSLFSWSSNSHLNNNPNRNKQINLAKRPSQRLLTSLKSKVTLNFDSKDSAKSGYMTRTSSKSARSILCKSQYEIALTSQIDRPFNQIESQ